MNAIEYCMYRTARKMMKGNLNLIAMVAALAHMADEGNRKAAKQLRAIVMETISNHKGRKK